MSNWFVKLFGGFGRISAKRTIPQQVQKTKIIKEITSKAESKIAPLGTQTAKKSSLGEQLSYGKWYYGVDTKVQPVVKRNYVGGIEKRYSCKDGGEVVVKYNSGAASSRLDITKVGNSEDIGRGDWYRGFYSDIAVKHYKGEYGEDLTKIIKKKGARKQVLSSQNGRATDEVHVPLKRWERIPELIGLSGKKQNSNIISSNPRDFDRFCD